MACFLVLAEHNGSCVTVVLTAPLVPGREAQDVWCEAMVEALLTDSTSDKAVAAEVLQFDAVS